VHVAPDLLTPQWMSRCLQRPIASAVCRRIGTDRGFAGTVVRVRLDDDAGRSSTVVAKLGPDPALEAEMGFYRLLAEPLAAPAPRCLYAGSGPDGRPLLLIEDLRTARAGDALEGAGADDVHAVLESMKDFWAADGRAPALTALPRWGSPPQRRQENFRRNWAAQREALRDELPEDVFRRAERLCDWLASVAGALHEAPAHPVHADLHLDNVLFTDDGPVVLDWGSVCRGAPVVDSFGFITTSLSPLDQQRHFTDLVRELGLDATSVANGRRRLLCMLAGVIGWRNRAETDVPRERALRAAAIGDGRLITALRLWDAADVLD
jgi:aminoglycoside phosphotransferase (APT) family kinase protein